MFICTYVKIFDFSRIGRVMVSVLASGAVHRGFEPRSGKTKDNKIGIYCFSAKHAALRRKSNQTSITTRKHKYS